MVYGPETHGGERLRADSARYFARPRAGASPADAQASLEGADAKRSR